MRHIKTMGLAVIAALALVAFAGATSASATTYLCSTNTAACAGGVQYTSVNAANSGAAVLTTSGGIINPRISCTSSNVGITGVTPGTPLRGTLSALTFTGCTSTSPAGCSASGTVTGLPTAGTATATGGGNGTLTVVAPRVSFTCPVGSTTVTCTFGGNSVTGNVVGGRPATVTFTNATITSTGGAACPTAARWSAVYATTGTGAYFLVT